MKSKKDSSADLECLKLGMVVNMLRKNSTVNIGVLLPTRAILMSEDHNSHGVKELLAMAVECEQAGINSVWVGDSVTAKPRLEPITVLSSIAVVTSSVRLGTAVLLGAQRHPVSLAHAASSLDIISGGRLSLGMGVGGAFNESQRNEWMNLGIDHKTRGKRLEELVKIFKPLTRGEEVIFDGQHFSVDGVTIQPSSQQSNGIPVIVAAHFKTGTESQYRRVGELGDGLISISDNPREYSQVIDKVDEYAMKSGRDPSVLDRVFYMTVNINVDKDKAEREADQFLRMYYGVNIWKDRWGPWGSTQEIVERMNEYVNAGAKTVIVRFASFEQRKQLDVFLKEVCTIF